MVGDLTIGKVFQENLGCLIAAFTGCKEKWCLLLQRKNKQTKEVNPTTPTTENVTQILAKYLSLIKHIFLHTLLSCMSLLAPFLSSTIAASTLFTAAAQ